MSAMETAKGSPLRSASGHGPALRGTQRGSWWRRWGEETVVAYLFLLPAMIILLVFAFFPVIFSIVTSFTRWNLPYKAAWAGLQNYQGRSRTRLGGRCSVARSRIPST